MIFNIDKETMPREKIREIQLSRLQDLCRRVYANVPFYRRSFDEKGIKPADVQSLDDLKFLRKGGRLSGAAAFAGTLLQIKPILQGDPEGKIVVLSKERGRKKAMDTLIRLYEEMVEDKSAPVGISHAAAPAEALHLATALRQAGCTGEILSVCHEPVTGAHVGPGMLALYFYSQTWR